MIENALSISTLSVPELALRIVLAMVFGFIIGYDRDTKDKPIDFRAYMIVAVTSCLVAITGLEIAAALQNGGGVPPLDQGKIIAGVLTGIGFLGAGCILQQGDKKVIGTATGASIWASGGVGLALGYGFYLIALAAFTAIAVILIGGGVYMQIVHDKKDNEEV